MAEISRRGFVATSGAASVLVAAPSWGPAFGAAATPVRVGVLTAGRGLVGSEQRLVRGLTAGFAASSSVAATLDTRSVDYGLVGLDTLADELIAAGAQVLVAAVATPASDRLAQRCADAGVSLVLANVGAHLVAGAPSAGVLHSSMQHWQAAFSAGQWAADSIGRTMFSIVAAPDAGYDSVFAVRRGFTSSGGTVLAAALTHNGSASVDDAARAARRSRAAVVAVSATGQRAAEIVHACRTAGVRAEFVVDALALGSLGRAGDGVHAVTTSQRGDAFVALGHDTALLVAEGVRRAGPTARLAESLAGARVEGKRGTLVVDRSLRTVSAPLAVHEVRSGRVRESGRRPRVAGVPAALGLIEGRVERGAIAAYLNEYLTT